MAVGNIFKSDLYSLHNVVQQSAIMYPKEIVIATLRDFFSHDSYYKYNADKFGFPNTPDHTDLPIDAGLNDNATTRLFVGENYRFDSIFYPAILVKHNGTRYVPISINREEGTIQWDFRTFIDGYGNVSTFRIPKSFIFAGAWEGALTIDILTRSLRSRDDLLDLVTICLTDITFKSLEKAGIICKPLSVSGTSETDDRNDKLFRQTITVDIRSEWRRAIPISNVIDAINFTVEFQEFVANPNAPVAQNLTIRTGLQFLDIMGGWQKGFTPPQ